MARPLVLQDQALMGGLQRDAVGQARQQSLRQMQNLDVVFDPTALRVRNGCGKFFSATGSTASLWPDNITGTAHSVYSFKLKNSSGVELDYIYAVVSTSSDWRVYRVSADRTLASNTPTLLQTNSGSLPSGGVQMVKVDNRVVWNGNGSLHFNDASATTSYSINFTSSFTLPTYSLLAKDYVVTGSNSGSSSSLFSQLAIKESTSFTDGSNLGGASPTMGNNRHDVMSCVGNGVLACKVSTGDVKVAINQIRLKFCVYAPPLDSSLDWAIGGQLLNTANDTPGADILNGFRGRFKVALRISDGNNPSSISDDIVQSEWVSVSSLESQVDTTQEDTSNTGLKIVGNYPDGAHYLTNLNPDSSDHDDRIYRNLEYTFEIPKGLILNSGTSYHVLLYGENAFQLGWCVGDTLTRKTNHASLTHDFTWSQGQYYNGTSWVNVLSTTGWTGNLYPKQETTGNFLDNTFTTVSGTSAGANSGKLVYRVGGATDTTAPTITPYFFVDFGSSHSDQDTNKSYYVSATDTVSGVSSSLSNPLTAVGVGDSKLIGHPVKLSGIQSIAGANKVSLWRKAHSGVEAGALTESSDIYRVCQLDLSTGSLDLIDITNDSILSQGDSTTPFSLNSLSDKDGVSIGLNSLAVWNERLWGFNGKVLRFSDRMEVESYLGQVGDPIYNSFHIDNNFEFSDDIKSIVPLTDGIAIFFGDKIKFLTGGYQVLNPPPDLAVRDVSMTDGIYNIGSGVSYKGQIVFANQHREIKLLSAAGGLQEISDMNQSLFSSLPLKDIAIYKNQIVVNGGSLLLLLDLSKDRPYWRQYSYNKDGSTALSLTGLYNDFDNRLIAYSTGSDEIYVLDEGNTDNGVGINVVAETHDVQHSRRTKWSKFQIEMDYASSSIPSITVTANGKGGVTSSKTFKAVSSHDVRAHTGGIRMVSESCSLQLSFQSSSADEIRYLGFA